MSNNTNPGHAVNAPGAVIEREELAGPDAGIEHDSPPHPRLSSPKA